MRLAILLLISGGLLLAPSALHTQDLTSRGEIHGRLIDDNTGAPIPGARVELLDELRRPIRGTVTDDDGRFRIPQVRSGPFLLRAARLGYRTTTTPRWRIQGGEVLQVEVRMDIDAVVLAPLEIVAARRPQPSPVLEGFRARMASGLGYFVTRADIEARNPSMISDMLAMVPGVHLEGSGSGLRRTIHMGRAGATRCPAQIFVDGFLFNRPVMGRGDDVFVIDDAVTPSSVEGIEIYRGLAGVPAEFLNPNSRCGVVVIWTRRGGPAG
jgi:hypothetical protein